MPRYLFDTDHLTLFQHGHAQVARRLALHTLGVVGISVVTVEETLRGRLASLARASDGPTRIRNYALLEQALLDFAQFPVVRFDQAAEANFQQLRALRIGAPGPEDRIHRLGEPVDHGHNESPRFRSGSRARAGGLVGLTGPRAQDHDWDNDAIVP